MSGMPFLVAGGLQAGANLISSYIGGKINYNLMELQNMQLNNEAKAIENDALQEVNMMRKQFNSAIGSVKYDAVNRGIKSTSGSVTDDLNISSKNLSEDINSLMNNAKAKGLSLKLQQGINDYSATANKRLNLLSGILGGSRTMLNAYGNYKNSY